jgi:hypothetical protein
MSQNSGVTRSGRCEVIRLPNDLDVRDRPQPLDDVLQATIAQHHRVAAGHDHVAHLGMRGDVLERRLVLVERDLLGIADLAPPGAEAAVAGAHRADQEQHAVGIPVRDVRHRRVAVLVERVDHAVDDLQLLDGRDELVPVRVADVRDLGERLARDAHLEVVERRLEGLDVDLSLRGVRAEPFGHVRLELLQRTDAFFTQDLLPVAHRVAAPRSGVRRVVNMIRSSAGA